MIEAHGVPPLKFYEIFQRSTEVEKDWNKFCVRSEIFDKVKGDNAVVSVLQPPFPLAKRAFILLQHYWAFPETGEYAAIFSSKGATEARE